MTVTTRYVFLVINIASKHDEYSCFEQEADADVFIANLKKEGFKPEYITKLKLVVKDGI